MIAKAEELAAMFKRNFEQAISTFRARLGQTKRLYEPVDQHSMFQIGIKV